MSKAQRVRCLRRAREVCRERGAICAGGKARHAARKSEKIRKWRQKAVMARRKRKEKEARKDPAQEVKMRERKDNPKRKRGTGKNESA